MLQSRLASLGLTTKLPKLKYNDDRLGEGGGGRGGGAPLFAFQSFRPRPVSSLLLDPAFRATSVAAVDAALRRIMPRVPTFVLTFVLHP